jgi:hypothetical protein
VLDASNGEIAVGAGLDERQATVPNRGKLLTTRHPGHFCAGVRQARREKSADRANPINANLSHGQVSSTVKILTLSDVLFDQAGKKTLQIAA